MSKAPGHLGSTLTQGPGQHCVWISIHMCRKALLPRGTPAARAGPRSFVILATSVRWLAASGPLRLILPGWGYWRIQTLRALSCMLSTSPARPLPLARPGQPSAQSRRDAQDLPTASSPDDSGALPLPPGLDPPTLPLLLRSSADPPSESPAPESQHALDYTRVTATGFPCWLFLAAHPGSLLPPPASHLLTYASRPGVAAGRRARLLPVRLPHDAEPPALYARARAA